MPFSNSPPAAAELSPSVASLVASDASDDSLVAYTSADQRP